MTMWNRQQEIRVATPGEAALAILGAGGIVVLGLLGQRLGLPWLTATAITIVIAVFASIPVVLVVRRFRRKAGTQPRTVLTVLRATRIGDRYRCEGSFTAGAARRWHQLVLDVDIREKSSGVVASHRCPLFYSLVVRDVSRRELLRERRSFRMFEGLLWSSGWRTELLLWERKSAHRWGEVVLVEFSLPAPGTYAVALEFPASESFSKGRLTSEATISALELRVVEGGFETSGTHHLYRRVALPVPPFEETPQEIEHSQRRSTFAFYASALVVAFAVFLVIREPSPSPVRQSTKASSPIEAVRDGKEVARLLAEGADPRQLVSGRTALVWAAYSGREDVVKELLDSGADPEATDSKGYTALMWAAQKGHTQVVGLLLDRGANVNAKDSSLRTPLMCAAWTGQVEVVRVLLARGADANALTRGGKTARDYAAMEHHQEVVDLLQGSAKP